MKSFKIAVITGAIALAAVIATIIIVTSGNSEYGLYVLSASGDVDISNTSEGISAAAAADTRLSDGDIVTVNDGGSCTLIYRTRDNYDENYIVLESSSQVFVTGEFDGKNDGELYLNRGSLLVSALEESARSVIIRTENASLTTSGAALHISYETGEPNCTYAASFAGTSMIQLYDRMGNTIDKDGNISDTAELMGSGLGGKVISAEPVPSFEYLNIPVELSDYSADTLRELLTVSAFYELEFSAADIKTAYDAVAEQPDSGESNTETDASAEITEQTVTTTPTASDTTSVTTTTTTPPVTTAPPVTTTRAPAATTTAPAATTAARTTTTAAATEERLIPVYIIIEDEIYVQDVPYGGDAQVPEIPSIDGKKFVQWDNSFENITEERTITAIFEDTTPAETTVSQTEPDFFATVTTYSHTVTININGNLTTQTVPDGGSAVLPEVNVPGYTHVGWDRLPENITSDVTITALLIPNTSDSGTLFTTTQSDSLIYTVTFVIDGNSYPVFVAAGGSAVPPFTPPTNSYGQTFLGWDSNFQNVNSNMTVTAIFGNIY